MRCRWIALLVVATACSATAPEPAPARSGLHEPYPYTRPTPPAEETAIDGVYERTLDAEQAGPAGPCRRCPPYRLEVATSTLSFDRGVFSVENEVAERKAIDWRSIGHYEVSGETLTLFNDPNCPTTRGTYRWRVEDGTLTLEVIDDPCAFGGLRWRYLTAAAWRAR